MRTATAFARSASTSTATDGRPEGYEFKIVPNTTCSTCDGAGSVICGDAPLWSDMDQGEYNPLSVPSILAVGGSIGSVHICEETCESTSDDDADFVCVAEIIRCFGFYLPSRVISAATGAAFVTGSLLLLVGTAGCCGMACAEPRETCSFVIRVCVVALESRMGF